MAFDGLVVANLVHELRTQLLGSRITKIAMPNKDELLFQIKSHTGNHKLLVSAGASLPLMYLTPEKKPSPMVAPAFCMLLRKHIGNAKIVDIYQLGLERIIGIRFEHLDELGDPAVKKLYVELMGKHSNIIFTDENDIILDSIKRIPSSVSSIREVLPGRTYFIPDELKKEDFFHLSLDKFKHILQTRENSISKALYLNIAGISPLIAEEICTRAGISSESSSLLLSDLEALHLFHTLELLAEDIKNGTFFANIIYENDIPVEFSSTKLMMYENPRFQVKEYPSISEVLFQFYAEKDMYMRIRQKSADLRKIVSSLLERASKKYDLQEKQLRDAEKKEKFKVYGDLLNTYGYSLQGGEEYLICENFYDDNKEIKIPLDQNLSAIENAKRYYEKYAKLKRTDEALSLEIQKTESDIRHLTSIAASLELASEETDLNQIKEELMEYGFLRRSANTKKEKLISKPLHFITKEGFHIYVGKNNYQNEELTFKIASPNDWWFHAKGMAGSHVIVKTENKELPDSVFEEAASLAAYYSKARHNEKVEIDYIQRKNIKKVPSSAPGFVIYHTNWSMMASPKAQI